MVSSSAPNIDIALAVPCSSTSDVRAECTVDFAASVIRVETLSSEEACNCSG